MQSCSPIVWKVKQENGEFQVSSGYTGRPCSGDERKSGEGKAAKKEEAGNTAMSPVPCGDTVRWTRSHTTRTEARPQSHTQRSIARVLMLVYSYAPDPSPLPSR